MQTDLRTKQDATVPEYDRANECYRLSFDRDGTATLPTMIVHALASIAEVDVSQGEFSLYDCVDPEALERLFAPKADGSPRSNGHVAFSALEHEVFVYAGGEIYIYPPSSDDDSHRGR